MANTLRERDWRHLTASLLLMLFYYEFKRLFARAANHLRVTATDSLSNHIHSRLRERLYFNVSQAHNDIV